MPASRSVIVINVVCEQILVQTVLIPILSKLVWTNQYAIGKKSALSRLNKAKGNIIISKLTLLLVYKTNQTIKNKERSKMSHG